MHFPTDTRQFLAELRDHNDREWFADHKDRAETAFYEPAFTFIEAIEPKLKTVSPFLTATAKKSGGSLMRIYRDVRFSNDKSPFKTNVGINFRHEAGKSMRAPGLYVHIAADEVFLAAGIWQPEKEPLRAIRDAIVADRVGWKRATRGKAFRGDAADGWKLAGDSLKRAPKDFDPEDPLIEDLRRKDFTAVADLKPGIESKGDFAAYCVGRFKEVRPLLRFLGEAVNLPV